ncbi:Cytochrome c oxidase, subunit IV/COX5b [Phaffia rhodozyma]|uniref:Cytochrome c oxidase, subunit IV/COX5b n=1 Tax=Phaffia rhodozyma TaxID=264483 RepID=A0A0F7SVC4_PHARH|nr:Cytochrome c oxidase, subunit IV/COX5b [Phaffia rhodozyma]
MNQGEPEPTSYFRSQPPATSMNRLEPAVAATVTRTSSLLVSSLVFILSLSSLFARPTSLDPFYPSYPKKHPAMFRSSSSLARAIRPRISLIRAASSAAAQPASSSPASSTKPTVFAEPNITTDPSLLPKAGQKHFSPYDALSAVNQAATPVPLWNVDITESSHFVDGKVPDLWSIEYLWDKIDQDTKDRITAHLMERSQGDWKDLSMVEKKALWYINYGPWGKRAPQLAHGEGWDIILYISGGFITAIGLWVGLRMIAPPPPKTMDIEWQRKSNEYLRSLNANPISGISSENYGKTGLIQSTTFLGAPKVY